MNLDDLFDLSKNWTTDLRRILNPENKDSVTKEELIEALSLLIARYLDDFEAMRVLEDYIADRIGDEGLEKLVLKNFPTEFGSNVSSIENQDSTESKARYALELLDGFGM